MENNYELCHYGVKGMKWGVRRAAKYADKARNARESAKEWKEIGAYKADKLRAAGKNKKADRVTAKYNKYAAKDRADARAYDEKAAQKQREAKFQEAQAKVNASRSRGSRLASNLIAGPFANRTYNSVLAAGGTKTGAKIATYATGLLGGPLGHIAVAHLYTKSAGERKTNKRY